MLYNRHFYHGLYKKYSKVIGAIFSDIDVIKIKENGEEDFRIKVPITYSSKEKFIRRITEDPDLKEKSSIQALPMIGYELQSVTYSPERKLSRHHKIILSNQSDDTGKVKSVMQPVPYDFTFQVTAIAATQEDIFQIMEQITPFFQPDFVVTMKGLTNPNLSFDVPISLLGVNFSDSYDDILEKRRIITCEFTLLLRGFLFGPVREGNVIKKVDIETSIVNPLYIIKEVEVVPFIDGVPLEEISPDDNFGFIITENDL